FATENVAYGRVIDSSTMKPLYNAGVAIAGPGVNDTFLTGPLGFYFFAALANGTYQLSANATSYTSGSGNVTVQMGTSATEAVRTDFMLPPGCSCPAGKVCGPSGGCLDPCVIEGEFVSCADPSATCVNNACVRSACDTLTCASGFTCVQGACLENACS